MIVPTTLPLEPHNLLQSVVASNGLNTRFVIHETFISFANGIYTNNNIIYTNLESYLSKSRQDHMKILGVHAYMHWSMWVCFINFICTQMALVLHNPQGINNQVLLTSPIYLIPWEFRKVFYICSYYFINKLSSS